MEIIKGKSILNKVAIGPILYHRKTESQVKRRTVEDTEAEVKETVRDGCGMCGGRIKRYSMRKPAGR